MSFRFACVLFSTGSNITDCGKKALYISIHTIGLCPIGLYINISTWLPIRIIYQCINMATLEACISMY